MKRAALLVLTMMLGCIVATYFYPPDSRYTSVSEIRAVNAAARTVLGRDFLARMIRDLRLYEDKLAVMPMEDLLDACKKNDIRISSSKTASGQSLYIVSFSYPDRHLAQRAAQRIATALVEQYRIAAETRSTQLAATFAQFADRAAVEIRQLEDRLAATPHSNQSGRLRVAADLELARHQLQRLRDVRAQAIAEVEIIRTASLPSNAIAWKSPMLVWGAAAGLALGLLILAIPFLRRVTFRQAAIAFACGAAVCLLTWAAVFHGDFHTYHSTSVIAAIPPDLPGDLLPWDATDLAASLAETETRILSRTSLSNTINSQWLYFKQRARQPMQVVVDTMRGHLRVSKIESVAQGPYSHARRIDLRYPGAPRTNARDSAQKATAEITTQFLTHHSGLQYAQAHATLRFVESETERAAREWSAALHSPDPDREATAVEAALARKRYIALRESSAKLNLVLGPKADVRPGPSLGIVEPANLPPDTGRMDYSIIAAATLAAIIAALIWKRPRPALISSTQGDAIDLA
ncbi:MAG: hypothetical protein HY820_40065 [Acidobacteria bacterium]|nr:hypothetical protein [Acidobacteriota bacterium]